MLFLFQKKDTFDFSVSKTKHDNDLQYSQKPMVICCCLSCSSLRELLFKEKQKNNAWILLLENQCKPTPC